MTIGDRIASRRTELGISQQELAAKLHVPKKTLIRWEKNAEEPGLSILRIICAQLQMSITEFLEEDAVQAAWQLKDQLFSEEHMYKRIETFAREEGLVQTQKALPCMRLCHEGQTRKRNWFSDAKVPYIVHPLMLACHAHALGIGTDEVLAACLLHDVLEDCGAQRDDLPVSDRVKDAVELLTFRETEGESSEEAHTQYYRRMRTDPIACIVKALDRCNNISTMAASFSRPRLIEYIDETQKYILPLLDYIKTEYPLYYDAIYVIKYHILSILETQKNMIMKTADAGKE